MNRFFSVCLVFSLLGVFSTSIAVQAQSPGAYRSPLLLVSDESWDVSAKPTNFGEYPLSAEQIPGATTTMAGGTLSAVDAAFFGPSQIIAGTKPIWRSHRAKDDWEAYQFRRVVPLQAHPIRSAILRINCDDAARVYINKRLVNPEQRSASFGNKNGGESLFHDLTAYLYSEVKTYDVSSYFFTNTDNVIVVEVANQPYGENHAYLSAQLRIEFAPIPEPPKSAPTLAKPPVKTATQSPKPMLAVAKPQPLTSAPVQTKVFQWDSKLDIKNLQVGSILELGNVYFKTNAYQLDSLSNATLQALVDLLQANPTLQIEIGGHTNLRPDLDFALKLSENRAHTVATYLSNRGIASQRIQYKGYGKTQPKVSGTSAEANRQNQRVEVKILAK